MTKSSAQECGSHAARPPSPQQQQLPPPPPPQHRSSITAPASLIRLRSTPPVPLPRPFTGRAPPHGLPDGISTSSDGVLIPGVDDGAPKAVIARLQQPHSTRCASFDPILNVGASAKGGQESSIVTDYKLKVVHTMGSSPVATPPEEGISSGSPSARTPVVEVTMPKTISPRTIKRTRDSTIGSSRFDRTKRARCMVGSPTLRIINQIQISPTLRSPKSTTTQNSSVNVQRDDTFDDWDQHRSVQLRTQSSNELSAYLAEATINRVDDFDILGWWKANSATYPVLAHMACDVLSTPATTVPSESAFNTGQRVISDFRSRLSTDIVEALICLQDWMRATSSDKLVLQVVAPPVYKPWAAVDIGNDYREGHSIQEAIFVS